MQYMKVPAIENDEEKEVFVKYIEEKYSIFKDIYRY